MKDIKSCVSYCGWLSDVFAVESGILQGCPFSSLVFVLAVKIRDCKDIKGIRNWSAVKDVNMEIVVKIADDITLFLQNKREMSNTLFIVEGFSQISGLEIKRSQKQCGLVVKNSV